MKNNKYLNYLDGMIKGCNVFACVMTSVIVALVVYFFDGYNLITKIKNEETAQVVATAVIAVIGIGLLIATTVKHVKDESVSVADNLFVTTILLFLFALVYCFLSKSTAFLEVKITGLACLVVYAIAVFFVRARYFKEYKHPEQIKGNASVIQYYVSLFKRFWLIMVVLVALSLFAIIYIEQQNVLMQTLNNKDLAPTVYIILGVSVAFYLMLMQVRLAEKNVNFIDISVIIGYAISIALLVIAFLLNDKARELAYTLSAIVFALMFVCSFVLIKNTVIYDDEGVVSTQKPSVKLYVKGLVKQGNLIYCTAVATILVAIVMTLEFTGEISYILAEHVKGVDGTLILDLVIIVLALMFAFLLCEIKTRTVHFADKFLATIVVFSSLMLIVMNGILGVEFIYEGLFPTITLGLSLVYVVLRILFIKDYALCTQTANKQVDNKESETANEQVAVSEVASETAVAEDVAETPIKLKRINVKKAFEIYVRTGDEQLKENYSQIKNALLSYGMHSRMTKSRENFSKKGLSTSKAKEGKALRLQAKLLVRGKFLKLYLNVDPTSIDAKYFRTKDVSDKSIDQPTYIKVRSKLSLKRALELIDILAKNEGFKLKKKFEPVDYVKTYTDEGLTYMQKLGYDYMVKDFVTLQEVSLYNDEWAEKIVKTEIIPNPDRYIYDEVTLKQLEENFNDGEIVSLEAMRQKELIKINCNYVTIKESESLSKKLIVEGHAISNKAIEMLFIAGGEVTRLIGE